MNESQSLTPEPWSPPKGALAILALTLLLILTGAGFALAVQADLIDPKAFNLSDMLHPKPTFEQVMLAQKKLDTARITVGYKLTSPSTETNPFLSKEGQFSELYKIKDGKADLSMDFALDNGMRGTFLTVDSRIYVSPEMASLFYAFSTSTSPELQGKWVEMTHSTGLINILAPEDPAREILEAPFATSSVPSLDAIDLASTSTRELINQVKTALMASVKDGAWTLDDFKDTQVNGQDAWDAHLSVDTDKLVDAFKKNAPELADGNEQTVRESLKTVAETLDIRLTILKKDKRIAGLVTKVKSEKSEGWNMNLTATIERLEANDVRLEKPAHVITPYEAHNAVNHVSEEDRLITAQNQSISTLRGALAVFKRQNGHLPTSLDQLVGIEMLLGRVKRIPHDIYTDAAYGYAPNADGTDYTLTYQIRFNPEGAHALGYVKYVNGTNTATSKHQSVELAKTSDLDKDGLTDYQEAELGTYTFSKDTDNDGYTDKEEVDSHHDPLTSAKTGKKVTLF